MAKRRVDRWKRDRRSLEMRDSQLRAMGFPGWAAYQASPKYDAIKRRFLGLNPLCEVCLNPASHVHFYSYDRDTLEGRDDRRLAAVCAECEERSHYRESDGRPLTTVQANAKLRQLVTLARKDSNADGWPEDPLDDPDAAFRLAMAKEGPDEPAPVPGLPFDPRIDPPFVPGSFPYGGRR